MALTKMLGLCLLFSLLTPIGARSQVVEFTNGDRLTGKLVSAKGTTITFDSDAVGTVTIPVAKIKSFLLNEPVVAVLSNKKTISGRRAQLTNGIWTIQSSSGAQQGIPPTALQIEPEAAYRATIAEKTSAEPWRNWAGTASFGYSLQRGSQQSRTLSLGFAAERNQSDETGISDRWRTTYSFNMLFAKSSASHSAVQLKSNSLTTSLRQDYFFLPNNFLFVLGQADHIETQNLYLGQTYGGGYGRDLLSGNRLSVSVLGGATFTNLKFAGVPAQQYAEALVGERVGLQISQAVRLDHSLNFYPNLSDTGRYRFDTTSALAFRLNARITANLGLTDFYISQIPSGSATSITVIGPGGTITTTTIPTTKNNLTLTAGVGVNF